MEKRIVIAMLAMGACTAELGRASDPPQKECDSRVYLQLRTGDSLRSLFGNEWAKVWRCNQIVFIRSGREVVSPDLVAAGQVIRVPPSTRLSPGAEHRLEELQSNRQQIERRLKGVEAALLGDSRARAVIEESRRVLSDPRHFVTDMDYLDRQIEYLEGYLLSKRNLPVPTREPIRQLDWILAAVPMALLAVVGWRLKHFRANSDLGVREVRAADRLGALCREVGIRLEP